MSEEMQITSEIHNVENIDILQKPSIHVQNVVTRFSFKLPSILSGDQKRQTITYDEDGDYDLKRNKSEGVIYIEHSPSTTLNLVGLQVWRGALLLADFILSNHNLVKDKVIVELGSGTGLASFITAMYAKTVICTDVNIASILELIKANSNRNKEFLKADFQIMDLNFYSNWSNEIVDIMKKTEVVLAADVIYDNDLTEAFVKTIRKIFETPPKKTIYIALEKRYVFTISDLEVVAPCYEYFLSCMKSTPYKMEEIPLNFDQYFNYDRLKHLILWKITSL